MRKSGFLLFDDVDDEFVDQHEVEDDLNQLCQEALVANLEYELLQSEADFDDTNIITGEASVESLSSIRDILDSEGLDTTVKYNAAATIINSLSDITGRETVETVEVPMDADVKDLQSFTTEFLKDLRRRIGNVARRSYRATVAFIAQIKVLEGFVQKMVSDAISAANSGDRNAPASTNTFKSGRVAEWIASVDDLNIKLDTFYQLRAAANSVGSTLSGKTYDQENIGTEVNKFMDEFANASTAFGSTPSDGNMPASVVIPSRKGLLEIATSGVVPAVVTAAVVAKNVNHAKIIGKGVLDTKKYFNLSALNKASTSIADTLAKKAASRTNATMGVWAKIKGVAKGTKVTPKTYKKAAKLRSIKLLAPTVFKSWKTIGTWFVKTTGASYLYWEVSMWAVRRIGGYAASRPIVPLTWGEMKDAKDGLVKLMSAKVSLKGLATASSDIEKLAASVGGTGDSQVDQLQKVSYSAIVRNLGTINKLMRNIYTRSFDFAKATALYITKSAKQHHQYAAVGTTESITEDVDTASYTLPPGQDEKYNATWEMLTKVEETLESLLTDVSLEDALEDSEELLA